MVSTAAGLSASAVSKSVLRNADQGEGSPVVGGEVTLGVGNVGPASHARRGQEANAQTRQRSGGVPHPASARVFSLDLTRFGGDLKAWGSGIPEGGHNGKEPFA